MIPCGSKETGEVNQKRRNIPEIIMKNKGTIKSTREGYTELILASEFSSFLGSRKVWNKGEGISI